MLTRRHFLYRAAASTGLFLLPAWLTGCASQRGIASSDDSPIQRAGVSPLRFSGDDPAIAHKVFWNLESFHARISSLPISETHDVVIVGGGMSGLLSAYKLQKFSPLVLEAGSRFGGHSRGEIFGDCEYSIGAAYFAKPEEGSSAFRLLNELDLISKMRAIAAHGSVAIHGKAINGFWEGQTDPRKKDAFVRVANYLKASGPDIPFRTTNERDATLAVDAEDLFSHLERRTGKLHAHVEQFLSAYCASALNATGREVSAAAALNFLSSEFGDTCTLPAGNASITEALYRNLRSSLGDDSLRSSSPVVQIEPGNKEVFVTYAEKSGALKKIRASRVVVACPKFVAKKIIKGIEPERVSAIEAIEYRAYAVGNACLREKSSTKDYNTVFLQEKSPVVTDVVNANYSQPHSVKGVFTYYHPLPTAEGRSALFQEKSFSEVKELIGAKLEGRKDVEEIRLARWGHALPVPHRGIYRSGVLERAHRPIGETIFFIEQDNWALPAFETALSEADHFCEVIHKTLKA